MEAIEVVVYISKPIVDFFKLYLLAIVSYMPCHI
jgi:hypothetical protein